MVASYIYIYIILCLWIGQRIETGKRVKKYSKVANANVRRLEEGQTNSRAS